MSTLLNILVSLYDIDLSNTDKETIETKLSLGVVPLLVKHNDIEGILHLIKMGYKLCVIREYLLTKKQIPTTLIPTYMVQEYERMLKFSTTRYTPPNENNISSYRIEDIQAFELVGMINPDVYLKYFILNNDADRYYLSYAKYRGASLPPISRGIIYGMSSGHTLLLLEKYPEEMKEYIPMIIPRTIHASDAALREKCISLYPITSDINERRKRDMYIQEVRKHILIQGR